MVWAFALPLPTSTRQPMILRTICLRNPSPVTAQRVSSGEGRSRRKMESTVRIVPFT